MTAPCSERRERLHAYADGELPPREATECRDHVATCPGCAAALAEIAASRRLLAAEGLRWTAPAGLQRRVAAAIAEEAASSRRGKRYGLGRLLDRLGRWSLLPAAAALAASLLIQVIPQGPGDSLAQEVVAGHIRSLLADHLTDVATSDQHTVKPWFSGRVDFAPPVVDLADRQFPLVGGRADYLDGRVVAALVYRHGGHVINLFVWPAPPAPDHARTVDGYSLFAWSRAGLSFWAVSDAEPVVLEEFKDDFTARAPQ